MPEPRPGELGLGGGKVDAVVDEGPVEVGLLFARPAALELGLLSIAFAENLKNAFDDGGFRVTRHSFMLTKFLKPSASSQQTTVLEYFLK